MKNRWKDPKLGRGTGMDDEIVVEGDGRDSEWIGKSESRPKLANLKS